jgi:hypothetical protein
LGHVKAEDEAKAAKLRAKRALQRRARGRGPSASTSVAADAARTNSWPETSLNEVHRQLARSHGLTDDIVAAAGLRSVETSDERAMLPGGVPASRLPALGFPIAELDEPVVDAWLFRLDRPDKDKRGRPMRYVNVTGKGWTPFYVLPKDAVRVLSSSTELWITEGAFDALALESKGLPALGLSTLRVFSGPSSPPAAILEMHIHQRTCFSSVLVLLRRGLVGRGANAGPISRCRHTRKLAPNCPHTPAHPAGACYGEEP